MHRFDWDRAYTCYGSSITNYHEDLERVFQQQIKEINMQLEKKAEDRIREIVREEIGMKSPPCISVEVADSLKHLNIDTTVTTKEDGSMIISLSSKSEEPPKKKKLDWSKMPVDTLVNVSHANCVCYLSIPSSCQLNKRPSTTRNPLEDLTYYTEWLTLSKNNPWQVWIPEKDGKCPVPEGVVVEVMYRNGIKSSETATRFSWKTSTEFSFSDIIAYRITGELAEGYEY